MERENNYDLLRVISCVAVIMVHVSSSWVDEFVLCVNSGVSIGDLLNPLMACFYNTVSRFCVPCFVMLSGAFIVDDQDSKNFGYFYPKVIRKIGIPSLIFCGGYYLYSVCIKVLSGGTVLSSILSVSLKTLIGAPFYHLWYLFLIMWIYLFAPFVIIIKDEITYEKFRYVSIVFLILASISNWTSTHILYWDLGQSFEYLSYFMIGYVIRKEIKKSNKLGITLIVMGLLIESGLAFAEYYFCVAKGILETKLEYRIISPMAPLLVLASVFVFSGFTALSIDYNKYIFKLSKLSFMIYLFHAGVWNFTNAFLSFFIEKKFLFKHINNTWGVPICVTIVFFVSTALSILCTKLINLKRFNKMKSCQ